MYRMRDYFAPVGDLSDFLDLLTVFRHGAGCRENCQLGISYARKMHFLTIRDRLPLLKNLMPGEGGVV